MKIKLWLPAFLAAATAAASAQSTNLTSLLQQGLLEEQGNRNFDAAIADYQSLAAQFDKDRQLAATAIFRLGECYRALGKTNEAAAQYQRIAREFSDQTTLALMSRQNLIGLGAPASAPTAPPPASAALQQQKELLAKQIALAQQNLAVAQQSFREGLETSDKVRTAESEVLRLQQQLAVLDSTAAASPENMDAKLWEGLSHLSGSELEKVLPTLLPDPVLENLLQERNQAESRLAELSIKDADGHPDVKGQKAVLETVNQQIKKKIEGMMLALNLRAAISRPRTASLAASATETNEVMADEDQEIQRITQMIQNSPDLINARHGGRRPLVSAAIKGELHVAAFLLDHGAEINPSDGDSPLHAAARNAQKTMVELLLNRGADINARPDGTALGTAAQEGYQTVVEVLLAHKADVNLPDGNGDGPLFMAAARGHAKIAQMLLAAKANPNAEDKNGETPLMAAVRVGSAEMVSELLAAGADANKANNQGIAPLSDAIENGSLEIEKLLLAAKADPNGGKLNSPLILAILKHNTAAAEILLAAGANPNAQERNGLTALQEVLRGDENKNEKEIAALLRQHGALDKPPRWNVIEVNRLSGHDDKTVFQKETNDWNHFTLLETILHYYMFQQVSMPFPDLSRVAIVRPSHNSTNETRLTVNLLDGTNGIDCSKDVPVEFGDMVEIPECEHSLGEPVVKLTESQVHTIAAYLQGKAQLVVHGQKAELSLDPFGERAVLGHVLQQPEARKLILSSSDLSRVKVTRHDPKTGESHEWVLDCNHPPPEHVDFRLRDGDVIEIPEKS